MKKIFFIIMFAALYMPETINCAPSISSINLSWNFTINGLGFGASPSSEWIGDDIEAGDNNTAVSLPSWNNFYASNMVKYSNEDKHSGSKSLKFDFYGAEYGSALIYNFGQAESEAYVTAWVKIVKNDGADTFQWKNCRFKSTNDYNVISGMYGDNWYYGQGNPYPGPSAWGNNDLQIKRNGVKYEISSIVNDAYLLGQWQRIEIYFKTSSAINIEDGVYEWRRIGRSGGEVVGSNYAVLTHDSTNADQLYQYVMIGHYYGNLYTYTGDPYAGERDAEIYWDDVYISNKKTRVEVGDNAIFANCTHREIQPALTWSDNSITGTFNQGSFNVGDTVYFFVVDENGVPSNGVAVTIGSEPVVADPVVEILTASGQITTASVFTITGTATADTGQTISGVTCTGQTVTPDDGTWDEQTEGFTCLVNLALGENTLVFVGSDGTRTGSDSLTVTRAAAPPSITNTSMSYGVLRH